MLADPQTITVNGVAKTLNKISSEKSRSIYRTDDEVFTFTVSHLETGSSKTEQRTKRQVRVDQRVVAANPLDSSNEYKTASVWFVIDEPEYGFSDTELDYIVQALKTWASTANVLKVLSHQH